LSGNGKKKCGERGAGGEGGGVGVRDEMKNSSLLSATGENTSPRGRELPSGVWTPERGGGITSTVCAHPIYIMYRNFYTCIVLILGFFFCVHCIFVFDLRVYVGYCKCLPHMRLNITVQH
jgi:hypothetical protein